MAAPPPSSEAISSAYDNEPSHGSQKCDGESICSAMSCARMLSDNECHNCEAPRVAIKEDNGMLAVRMRRRPHSDIPYPLNENRGDGA